MTSTTPPPTKRITTNGGGHGRRGASNGHNGHASQPPAGRPARRTSIFPLMLDFGLVLALFGLIILRPVFSELAGNIAIGVGAVIAVIALVGWLREARADYEKLSD